MGKCTRTGLNCDCITVRCPPYGNIVAKEASVTAEEIAQDRQPVLKVAGQLLTTGWPKDALSAVLEARGSRYGQFKDQAVYADDLNKVCLRSPNWEKMDPDMREALRIINNKIARILNGDPWYDDSWVDIAGYAKLVAERLKGNNL